MSKDKIKINYVILKGIKKNNTTLVAQSNRYDVNN